MSAGAEASVQSSFDQDLAEVLRIKDAHKRASFNPVLDEHGAQAHYDIERLLEFIENLWRAYSVEANKQERLRATLSPERESPSLHRRFALCTPVRLRPSTRIKASGTQIRARALCSVSNNSRRNERCLSTKRRRCADSN